MKTSKFILSTVLSLVFVLLPSTVKASTYYVATNGNDSNAGTLASPFLTIQRGLNAVSAAGDILYIRGGNYSVGALTFTNKNGTATQKITISGYESERPFLNAAGRISSLWDNFIYLNNLQHVTFKNLEIANSRTKGIYLAHSNFVTFDNVWIHHTALAAIWSEAETNDLIIENSRFRMNNLVNDSLNANIPSGYSGAWYQNNMWMGGIHPRGLECDDPSTSEDDFRNFPACSQVPHTTNITIRKNTIYDQYGECINAHGRLSNLVIEDNVIYNCWAPAVYFTNDKNVLIQRNLIYHTGDTRFLRGGNPGSAIGAQKEGWPTRPGEMKNIRIINNFVKGYSRSFFFWQAMGGYLEDTLVAHNTFVDAHSNSTTKTNNIDIGPGPHINTRFENNMVIQNDTTANIGTSTSSVSFSNNFWSIAPPSNMSGTGDVISTVNIARTGSTLAGQLSPDYFKLLSNSPAINKAKELGITEDYFRGIRSTPDIGAHEFGGATGTTPPTFNPADMEPDGDVDLFDFSNVVSHFGQTGSVGWIRADIIKNGRVDIFDFNKVIENFGQ